MWRDESLPLDHDEDKVENIEEHQTDPDTEIIEDFDPSCSIEVSEDSVVEIGLVSHMDDA